MSDGNSSSTLTEYSIRPDDLVNHVSRLQALLESESLALDTKCLLHILEQCFLICAVESLDEQIFRKILPKAHHFLSQIVRAIDAVTGNNARIDSLDDVKNKLRICDGLLAMWQKCIDWISAFEKIQAPHIASLCSILPETIKIIFEHCKTSLKTYGILLSEATQELRNLFSRAGAIFKLFFATLDGVIVFDTNVESETDLLMKVIDMHGSVASIAHGMDTKTFIDISEAFGALAIIYQSDIKRTSPSNVTMHLARIAKDASCLLSTIKEQDDKNAERIILAVKHSLKILEKLTTAYGSFLTHEMMLYLIELSTQMHGYLYLSIRKGNTISANVASFLDIIFNHNDFKQAYFEYGRRNDVCRLNYYLLTIAIMKKLNSTSREHRCKWSLGSDSIFDIAFIYIEHLQEEICVGEIRLPGVYGIGDRPRLVGIYEATLISICDLVSQISPEDFHILELFLLRHLLSGRFWSSLLSSDIWCFIGRLGTSRLCVDHVKYLIKVSAALAERCDSIEAILLNNMVGRLYELLTEDTKSALLDDLTILDTDHYAPILYSLAAKTTNFHSERSVRNIKELPKAFSELQEHPTTRNWKRLMQLVSATRVMNYSDNENTIDILIRIWNFVVDAINECEGKQLEVSSDLIVVLLEGACPANLRDDVFDTILTSIAASCIYTLPRAKIKICRYLQQSTENLDRCGIRNASALIELFSRLLEDKNPWVRQEALESFERVAHACSERLVARIAKTLAKIPSINNIMQAYLSGTSYYVLEDFANAHDYLKHVVKTVENCRDEHTCYAHEELEREKMPKLQRENSRDMASVTLTQLDEQAERLYDGLTRVLEGRANISDAACKKLITVLEKILKTSEEEISRKCF